MASMNERTCQWLTTLTRYSLGCLRFHKRQHPRPKTSLPGLFLLGVACSAATSAPPQNHQTAHTATSPRPARVFNLYNVAAVPVFRIMSRQSQPRPRKLVAPSQTSAGAGAFFAADTNKTPLPRFWTWSLGLGLLDFNSSALIEKSLRREISNRGTRNEELSRVPPRA